MNNVIMEGRRKTSQGKELCKFDLFVRLYPDIPSIFPKMNRVHTFRGDAHKNLDTDAKMLIYLMNIVRKYWKNYTIILIRDNDYRKGDPFHELFSMRKKNIQQNILHQQYPQVFEDMLWPEWLIREKIFTGDTNDEPY